MTRVLYRVFFFLLAPPQKCFDWPPPKLSKCWNHIHFARHLGVFRSEGGPVWDSNVFLKSVTYRPTLSKFRGGPFKKITLYILRTRSQVHPDKNPDDKERAQVAFDAVKRAW